MFVFAVVDQLSYRLQDPQRGDVIVLRYSYNRSQNYIKRIIGLPGETIEIQDNKIVIYYNGKGEILKEKNYLPSNVQTVGEFRIQLNYDEFFVLGDNRAFSSDSRSWGPVKREDIVGKVFVRAWPPTALARIETPAY